MSQVKTVNFSVVFVFNDPFVSIYMLCWTSVSKGLQSSHAHASEGLDGSQLNLMRIRSYGSSQTFERPSALIGIVVCVAPQQWPRRFSWEFGMEV